ncbi:hypothetical protein Bca4012_085494 [Brassica carinata]
MWWPLWPPLFAVKFDVIVVVHRKGGFRGDGVVEWNEEFKRGLNQGTKEKVRSFGKASLNIAEYFSLMKEDDVQVKVPLKMCGSSSSSSPPCLHDITTLGQSIFCLVFFVKGMSCSSCPREFGCRC